MRFVPEETLNDIERQMAEDLDWAASAPEVQQHHGKLVVVYQKRVLAVGTDEEALLMEATEKARCPKEHLVVEVVPPRSLQEIPH